MLENNQRYYGLWCCHFYLTANESHTMLTLQSITSKSPQTTLLKFYTSIYSIFKPPSGKIYIKSVFPLIPSSCYSVVKSCPTLCDPMDCSTPGFPVLQYLLEFAQTRVHWVSSVQFSSAAQSCPTLCNPMNRSMPGFPVHYQLPKSTQTHVNLVDDAIQPSHPVIPFSSRPQSFPASGPFPMSQLFSSGGQSIGVSALTSVPPMNTQDWSPLGWIGWISLQSKGLSRVFSNTTLSQWYYLTISSSATLFSFCLQSFPESGSFPMSQFFTSGGQSTGASASVLPMYIQGWFPLGLTGLISLLSKGLSRVFSSTTIQKHQFSGAQPSLWSTFHIRTWLQVIALTIWTFVSKMMSLLFHMISRFVITFPFKEQASFNFPYTLW